MKDILNYFEKKLKETEEYIKMWGDSDSETDSETANLNIFFLKQDKREIEKYIETIKNYLESEV